MVTTATPYTLDRNQTGTGQGYDGVVRVSLNGYYGTGALLYGGRAILTAAHLFDFDGSSATVFFNTTAGAIAGSSYQVAIHPSYDPFNGNNDLALVWLNSTAPLSAERYTLYRASDEIGRTMTLSGYGTPGTGQYGTDDDYSGPLLRLKAENTFDADAAQLKSSLGAALAWSPLAGSQLIADFDNGTFANDALGRLINQYDTGLSLNEGLISSGDSGGPAFLNGKVAGVASYTASLSQGTIAPDIDMLTNSSYGEISAWQRVSYYQQWIDQSLRQQYPHAPTKPEEVQKQVPEGNNGTTYAYFLLQFTAVRSNPNDLLSVDYATRNGTAIAGQDYLATSGVLKLYPGETQAVIPVEIIGDSMPENDETFYLDVTNPVGGSFGEGVVKLTAVRTILNDDAWG